MARGRDYPTSWIGYLLLICRPVLNIIALMRTFLGADVFAQKVRSWGIPHLRPAVRDEYTRLFLVVVFPIHIWALINLLDVVPAVVLHLSVFQLIGLAAYILVFALFESLVVFSLLFLASLAIPPRFYASQLVPVGMIWIFCLSLAAAVIHLHEKLKLDVKLAYWAVLWIFIALAVAGWGTAWAVRSPHLRSWIASVVERLSLLSWFYLGLDGIALVVVLGRNLF